MIKAYELSPTLPVGRCAVRNPNDELLLIKRELSADHNAGLWEFAGGKIDIGEIVGQATIREVREETGLDVDLTSDFVLVDNRVISDGELAGSVYMMFCAAGKAIGGKLKLSKEHTDSEWEAFDAAMGYELTPETRKAAIMLGELALIN